MSYAHKTSDEKSSTLTDSRDEKEEAGRQHLSVAQEQGSLRAAGPVIDLGVEGQGAQNRVAPTWQVQPKLTVNERGDKYEKEAERVADAVMAMSDSAGRGSDRARGGAPRHRLVPGDGVVQRQQDGPQNQPPQGQPQQNQPPQQNQQPEQQQNQQPQPQQPQQEGQQGGGGRGGGGAQAPLDDMSTVQAASRASDDGCNGLFGNVRGPDCNQSHDAVDYHAPVGTATYAVTGGQVRNLNMRGYGNSIIFNEDGGETAYLYAHLSGYDAENGDNVEEGDQIGQTGTSGNANANRPHLHFEVHPNGWRGAEDPLNHGFPTPTDERVYSEEQGWHVENFNIEDCDCYAG